MKGLTKSLLKNLHDFVYDVSHALNTNDMELITAYNDAYELANSVHGLIGFLNK